MVIGLGTESLIETSITLHRAYGVPYIPGSALKGLAARWARTQLDDPSWRKDENGYAMLFGNTETAGFVTFHDALFVPGSGHDGRALWPDVITVHHAEYYSSGARPPTDWDSPTPVPFLTATGKYLVALSGPDEWVNTAFGILEQALENEGIGAKTTRGYGRMKLSAPVAASPNAVGPTGRTDDSIERLRSMKPNLVANGIGEFVKRWRKLKDSSPEQARALGKAIVEKVETTWRGGTGKDWFKEIRSYLSGEGS
jgi:CRISPR-associated protein Cmr6